MPQGQSLGDAGVTLRQRLVREAETKKGNSQLPSGSHAGVVSGRLARRLVGNRIVKSERLLQMGAGQSKPAYIHQGSTGGGVAQNEPGGVVVLTAQAQQVLVEPARQIEFAAIDVIEGLAVG